MKSTVSEMARKYHIEGTKTYLVYAIGLLLVGLLCVKDGWFPSEATLLRHPLDKDTGFYLFNKSFAFFSLIGSAICGYIHLVVK
jgi:hypothetical protein